MTSVDNMLANINSNHPGLLENLNEEQIQDIKFILRNELISLNRQLNYNLAPDYDSVYPYSFLGVQGYHDSLQNTDFTVKQVDLPQGGYCWIVVIQNNSEVASHGPPRFYANNLAGLAESGEMFSRTLFNWRYLLGHNAVTLENVDSDITGINYEPNPIVEPRHLAGSKEYHQVADNCVFGWEMVERNTDFYKVLVLKPVS